MKKILFALLLQIPFLVFAQDKFNLKGEIQNLKQSKKLYLIRFDGRNQILDSTQVTDGKFDLSIDLNSPTLAVLLLDHHGNDLYDRNSPKDFYQLFIEPGKATLSTSDSISKSKISGLAIFKHHDDYLKSTQPLESQLKALNAEFNSYPTNKKTDPDFAQSFQDRYENLMSQRTIAVKDFVLNHPNSYISVYALLSDLAGNEMNVELAETAYKGLSDSLKERPDVKITYERIKSAKKLAIGAIAPDFTEKTAEQVEVKLSDFKGKYVLIDFWASWCGPCRQENPNVLKAYETFKDKNFTILGVSIDEREQLWTKAVKTDGLVWPQLLDRTQAIAYSYEISSIPRNFLLDPNGKIIAKNLRGPELIDTLNKVLNKKK